MRKFPFSPIFTPITLDKGCEYAFSSQMHKISQILYCQNYCGDLSQILYNDKDAQVITKFAPQIQDGRQSPS